MDETISGRRLKAAILEGMIRRRQWSMSYKTVEDTLSKMPKRLRGRGREVVDGLVKEGWAEYHKNGQCVSLRSAVRERIREFVLENGDMPGWMLEELF